LPRTNALRYILPKNELYNNVDISLKFSGRKGKNFGKRIYLNIFLKERINCSKQAKIREPLYSDTLKDIQRNIMVNRKEYWCIKSMHLNFGMNLLETIFR
jgi:hypothetical protein